MAFKSKQRGYGRQEKAGSQGDCKGLSAWEGGPQAEAPQQVRGLRLYPEDTEAKKWATQLSNSSGCSVEPKLGAGTLEPECGHGIGLRPEMFRAATRRLANHKEQLDLET